MSSLTLELRDIHKSYSTKTILSAVTWTINRGERYALIGENGAGKTTLCKIMLRQIEPDSGTVHHPPQAEFAYLPQEISHEGLRLR
ncbi:MAG: ATP-binding cassette domain-containing protein [Phototrophicaceae bacterium]|jgi:ATP-binding cassette subfamily F protein uup